ncbi:hypothetical protein AAIG39_17360 [Phytobacter palmae]|uniref:Uncharacterized protein n=1 Tax=Phytobacter palmae TaxID=1855371 RepID=A0ABU9V806_9ENTR
MKEVIVDTLQFSWRFEHSSQYLAQVKGFGETIHPLRPECWIRV